MHGRPTSTRLPFNVALSLALAVAVLSAWPVPRVFAVPCAASSCDPKCERRCADLSVPTGLAFDGKTLCLNGLGLREATIFNVNVYLAGLFVERTSRDGEALARSEQLKVMRLRFVRDVGRDEISEAITNGFKQSAGAALQKLQPSIARLTAALPVLKVGDTLILAYRPGRGLELSHGTRVLVEIPGAEFAAALFRIWLGAHPPNAGLRTGLLGGACD